MSFESPSRLKPRNVTKGNQKSTAESSIQSFIDKSKNQNQNQNQPSKDENEFHDVSLHSNNHNDDDNKTLSETIKRVWRKRRRRERRSHHHRGRESPETLMRFVNIAKGLLLVFFISWNIHFYNKSIENSIAASALSSQQMLLDGELKSNKMNNEVTAISDETRDAIKARLQKIKEEEIDVPRLATKPSRIRTHNPSITIPPNLDLFYQDITSPRIATDIPIFWHILKSGGTTMKDLFGECMDKVEASEAGVLDGHINDSTIQKITLQSKIQYINGKYVAMQNFRLYVYCVVHVQLIIH